MKDLKFEINLPLDTVNLRDAPAKRAYLKKPLPVGTGLYEDKKPHLTLGTQTFFPKPYKLHINYMVWPEKGHATLYVTWKSGRKDKEKDMRCNFPLNWVRFWLFTTGIVDRHPEIAMFMGNYYHRHLAKNQ